VLPTTLRPRLIGILVADGRAAAVAAVVAAASAAAAATAAAAAAEAACNSFKVAFFTCVVSADRQLETVLLPWKIKRHDSKSRQIISRQT